MNQMISVKNNIIEQKNKEVIVDIYIYKIVVNYNYTKILIILIIN